jgi:hypothetical protein
MPKQVNGFLANDGSFFENEPECQRYEAEREIITLCETHKINFENFMATLNAWHNPIGRYYDADDKCKVHQVGRAIKFEGPDYHDDYDIQSDDIPAFLPTEEDRANDPRRNKDAPGFLEQQIRGRK